MKRFWVLSIAAVGLMPLPALNAQIGAPAGQAAPAPTGQRPGAPPDPQAAAPSSGTQTPAAAATATPSSQPAASAVSPDYQIGPGDSLEITVWKEPNISGTLPVRPDGMISLPLVGDIQASGLTPLRLGDTITERLKKTIINPVVTVTVLGVKSKNIYLIGEIGKPGELALTPGLTPLQAIASAGGLSQFASAKRIYILRGASGNQQKIPFDYKKAIKNGNLQGVTLMPGDTIVVP